jgi:hypothetical protein
MFYKGLKSLDKLDIIEEIERVAAAKVFISISDFNFLKILLNPIKKAAF